MSLSSLKRSVGRRMVLVLLGATLINGVGCSGNPAPAIAANLPAALQAAGPLLESLGKSIPGLSQLQAILGAGSMLGLAKARMPADQFGQIAGAIPGADALVAEAVKQGLPSGLTGVSGLTGFLGKSGLSADQITKMGPVIAGAVKGKVSPALETSFLSALQ